MFLAAPSQLGACPCPDRTGPCRCPGQGLGQIVADPISAVSSLLTTIIGVAQPFIQAEIQGEQAQRVQELAAQARLAALRAEAAQQPLRTRQAEAVAWGVGGLVVLGAVVLAFRGRKKPARRRRKRRRR